MKHISCLACLFVAGCALWQRPAVTLTAGNTEIVLPEKAPKTVQFAAREMQTLLGAVLGAQVPIVHDFTPGKCALVLGTNAWTQAAGIHPEKLARDGFVIKTAPGRVYIAGCDDPRFDLSASLEKGHFSAMAGSEHATLFGVYEFLRRYANCRFFFPGEYGTITPRAARVDVPETDLTREPYFTQRNPYMGGDGAWFDEPPAQSRNYSKGKALHWLRLALQTQNIPCCHGQNQFMISERFEKTHPEYFQLRKDGSRCIGNTHEAKWFDDWKTRQLCHSSKVWDEIYADTKSYLTGEKAEVRGIPSRWTPGKYAWNGNCVGGRYVDIMPQDGMSDCYCKACQAAYRKDRKCYATDLIWGQTAKLAQRLKDEGVPGTVTQMAYGSYGDVPDFPLPNNIQVIVARQGPWTRANPEKRAQEIADYRAWSEKTGRRVQMWTYPHKFGEAAIPGVPSMGHRAWGEYFQLVAPYAIGGFCESESDRAIFNYFNYYVFSRIAWDPNLDLDALIEDHHRMMFGKGAKQMGAFYDALEKKWVCDVVGNVADTDVGPVARVPEKHDVWTKIYSPDVLAAWDKLIDAALAAVAQGSDEAKRIAFIRRQFLDVLKAESANYLKKVAVETGRARRAETKDVPNVLAGGACDSLEGWQVERKGTASVCRGASVEGAASIKLVSTNRYAAIRQFVTLKPNTKYRVSFFAKLEGVKLMAESGGLFAEFWTGNWVYFPMRSAPTGTRDWFYSEYEFTTGEKTTDAKRPAYFHLMLARVNGTAYLDDVKVEEVR